MAAAIMGAFFFFVVVGGTEKYVCLPSYIRPGIHESNCLPPEG